MNWRLPLYAKIVLMLFANLVVVVLAFVLFFKVQLKVGLETLLSGRTGDRIRAVTDVMAGELRGLPQEKWDSTLARFSEAYELEVAVFRDHRRQYAGPSMKLPAEVEERLRRRGRGRGGGRPTGGGEGAARVPERPPFEGEPPEAAPRSEQASRDRERPGIRTTPVFLLHSDEPKAYWIGVRAPTFNRELKHPPFVTLILKTPSLTHNGLFLDIRPWIFGALAVILLCILFWLPFVRGITRYLRQMTEATESVARGSFQVHVSENRSDELGRLGGAINRMSNRLEGFVTGQKRFLGDIAHELCSPVARMQLALGVLERKASGDQKDYVADVQEEAHNMSEMVDELLAFSKASIKPASLQLKAVPLKPVLDRVLRREAGDSVVTEIKVADTDAVMADEGLLFRALANVIRNAVRYAGSAGPIRIESVRNPKSMTIKVIDAGPGVPSDVVDKLFDPFYRPEASRSLEFGGSGLGLAIVKTCVESCEGEVSCRNVDPTGFEVQMHLQPAELPLDNGSEPD